MKFIKSEELDETITSLNDSLQESIEESENFNEYLFEKENNKLEGSYKTSILLNPSQYKANPYFDILNKINLKKSNIVLKNEVLHAFSSFLYNETISENPLSCEINPIGHFNEDYVYPVIYKKNTPWMSLVPHEINTMAKPICEAKGDVLTYGLGLGYYSFMVAQKSDVKSVTIVDNDPNIISIYKNEILPHIPFNEKINIIQGNCVEFSKRNAKPFDFLFVDTYHTPEDGLPFLIKLKPYLSSTAKQYSFWILDSILTYFKRYLIMAIVDIYFNDVKEDEFSQDSDDYLDNILASVIHKTKDITIASTEDLLSFLSTSNIKTLLFK